MTPQFDSIYPDFLRAGLGKLEALGVDMELLALFNALEHFRHDLQAQQEIAGLLEVTHRYVASLRLCCVSAFHLVNQVDQGFELAFCAPEEDRAQMEEVTRRGVRNGKFAWALRQNAPVFLDSRGAEISQSWLFHSLAVSTHTVGMFVGMLHPERMPSQEIAFSLLSMLLGTCADALAVARKTADLTKQINTLSGLLPICAWCKKVRDDQGYWKQIESYVESRTEAVFSHGVCPDCARAYLKELK